MRTLPELPPGLDRKRFEAEVLGFGKPVILRGLAGNWPAVMAARASNEQFVAYLKRFATDQPQGIMVGGPEIGGRFGYTPDFSGLNFGRGKAPLPSFLDHLQAQRDVHQPAALALQAGSVAAVLPGFASENRLALLDPGHQPRVWIGNAATVATHQDPFENVAVAVAGRRRITLFPPDQVGNLYLGPFEHMPGGVPTSVVDVDIFDPERHPRLPAALEVAERGELAPGDAIYIPVGWWHHVASLDPLSVLVNYWWSPAPSHGEPLGAMLHALLAIRNLPAEQRANWRAFFDHFVFETDGPAADHLPLPARGVLGPPTPEWERSIKSILRGMLQ